MQMIAAADAQWGIGYKGDLLCSLHEDMKYFKEKTSGHTVVMGRATLESLPHKRGLPKRRNIVLTTRENYEPECAEVVHSVSQLMDALGDEADDAFVIGGARVYEELLPYCDVCWITRIGKAFTADRHLPDLDEDDAFQISWESEEMEEDGIPYRFVKYERKK
jgi:dihydrofolate reductase